MQKDWKSQTNFFQPSLRSWEVLHKGYRHRFINVDGIPYRAIVLLYRSTSNEGVLTLSQNTGVEVIQITSLKILEDELHFNEISSISLEPISNLIQFNLHDENILKHSITIPIHNAILEYSVFNFYSN